MGGTGKYASVQERLSTVRFSRKPLREFTETILKKLCDEHNWRIEDVMGSSDKQLIVVNRSDGAISNFFTFITVDGSGVNVFLTDPRDGDDAIYLKRDEVTINRRYECGFFRNLSGAYETPRKAIAIAEMVLNLSKLKPENSYYSFTHAHIGSINLKEVWDDGTTTDLNWRLARMYAHADFCPLTSHNWTHGADKREHMTKACAMNNMVFVPGCEITATITDNFRSPHILVYCINDGVAEEVKKFLARKLDPKEQGMITPTLCGPPGPFEDIMDFLVKLRDEGKIAIAIAHPASTIKGIGIIDPTNIRLLGEKQLWDVIFVLADAVESCNFSDSHSAIDFDMADGLRDKHSAFLDSLLKRMRSFGLRPYPSPAMINCYIGREARERNKWTFAGQDDHTQRMLRPGYFTDMLKGHTRFTITEATLERLKKAGRKPTAEEFVRSIVAHKFPLTEEPVEFQAVTFTNMTDKGPVVVDARMPTTSEKCIAFFREDLPQLWRYAEGQLKYWLGDEEQKREIDAERRKAYAKSSKFKLT